MHDSQILSAIIVCGTLWAVLWVMEYGIDIYNRCKQWRHRRRARKLAAVRRRIRKLGYNPDDLL